MHGYVPGDLSEQAELVYFTVREILLGAAPICSELSLLCWDEGPSVIQASVSDDPGSYGSIGKDNCNVSPCAVATDPACSAETC